MPGLWGASFLVPVDVARAARVCREWRAASSAILETILRAATKIQNAVRRCLALRLATRLRHDRFLAELFGGRGSPADIPLELWAAFQAVSLTGELHDHPLGGGLHPWVSAWAHEKLQRYSMPAPATAYASGPGLLGALHFMRRLTVDQLWCLGV